MLQKYQAGLARERELKMKLADMAEQRDRQQAEIERLRTALRFYADEYHYGTALVPRYDDISADRGKRARRALDTGGDDG